MASPGARIQVRHHAEKAKLDDVVAGGERLAVVEECRLAGGAFDPVGDERGVAGGVVLLEEELAVGGGSELDVLVGVWARALRGRTSGRWAEYEFGRGVELTFAGDRGQDGLGPDVAFAAGSLRRCKGTRRGCFRAEWRRRAVPVIPERRRYLGWRRRHEACRRSVEAMVAWGSMGVVVLDRCGVDLIDDDGGLGERRRLDRRGGRCATAFGWAGIFEQGVEVEFVG